MNFKEYAPLALRTAKPFDHVLQVQHAQLGMITELGEAATDIKNHFVYGKPFDVVNTRVEIGDYAWYLNLFCDEMKIHPSVLDDAVITLSDRDYNGKESDVQLTLMLASLTGAICVDDVERGVSDVLLAKHIAGLLAIMAHRWGTTIGACLDNNIAKLAKRFGDKYSDYAALNRDVDAERKIAEGGTAA